MRLFFTSFVIFFGLLSASFSEEIKDVGLICKRNGINEPIFSNIWFKGNKTIEIYDRDYLDNDKDGDTFEIRYEETHSKSWSYYIEDGTISVHRPKTIIKSDGTKEFILYGVPIKRIDRFTLKMEEGLTKSDVIGGMVIKNSYQCEVFSPKDVFLSAIKKKEDVIREFFSKRKI